MMTTPPVPACIAQWNQPANKARLAVSRLHPKSATVAITGKDSTVTWGGGKPPTETDAVVCVLVFQLDHKTLSVTGHLPTSPLGPGRVGDWSWIEMPAAPANGAKHAVTRDGKLT